MRLQSVEKAGYYAFPDAYLPALASLFAPTNQADSKFIDPCAGGGRALHFLTQALNLVPYANELDDQRAAECKKLFGPLQAVHGDMYQLKASNGAFVGAWVNPPYSWDKTGDEKRREFGMLKHSLKWVQHDGILLWCVYGHHITLEATTWLAKHSSQLDIWKIPGLHLGEYTHVVAIARIGQPQEDPGQIALRIVQAGQANVWPELTVQANPCYEFPAPLTRKAFLFAPKVVSPELALQFVRESGVQFTAGVQLLIEPEPPAEIKHPVVQPRGGQLGLILAGGMFNGLVLPTEKGRMAVRSTIESVEALTSTSGEVDEEKMDVVDREVYRTQSRVTITLLGEDGSLDDISGDAPIASFIKTHKAELLHYLDEYFTPLYNFDYQPLRPILNAAKQGKLYGTQKHVIAACHEALQKRKSVILVGEPGCGKSVMGATVAATLQMQMNPGQVVLILCPPHLVEKWEREVKTAYVLTFAKILRNVEDVVSFMTTAARNNPKTLNIGILSRETAKLGEGWEIAVHWQKSRLVRWPYGTPRPTNDLGQEVSGDRIITREIAVCPSCGNVVSEGEHKSHRLKRNQRRDRGAKPSTTTQACVGVKWLNQIPRFCPHCDAALWTQSRTFSKGKKVGNNPKNPRTPLAEFIAKRYGDQLYLFISDELHECKSASTDQGEAMAVLANAATKTLGLTGTLYGGAASSLYAIEYAFNPRVRSKYPWGAGINKWVRDMGTLERIVEHKPQYDKAGVYSGKRRVEHKPQEAPGCSPLLVTEIIDHCVFVGLNDMGRTMPDFEEIPVPIVPDPEITTFYEQTRKILGEYLFRCRLEGDSSALGMYLQTLLSWPNAPFRTEPCVHRKRLTRDSDEFVEIPVHTIPGLPEERIYNKEAWLLDVVRDELAQGRGIAIFVRQTGKRDIQPRLAKLLTDHLPSAKPYILKGTVKADQRESLLNKQVEMGTNILICNPRLVQTGLDLIDFPTIIFHEIDYSLYVMGQASRRAWRLIQNRPCKVYYPFYENLMENQAVELIGRKQQAAALLYGENTETGLSSLNGDDGGNLLAVLAAEIGKDAAVTDLRALFARHATPEGDLSTSAWFVAEEVVVADPSPMAAEVVPTPDLFTLAPVVETEPTPVASPNPVKLVLPPRPKYKHRRVNLMDAPESDLTPVLQMLAGVQKQRTTPVPYVPSAPVTEAVQMALF